MADNANANFKEFLTLPISMPPQPNFNHRVTHSCYIRKHAPRITSLDDSRSLFISNVPFDSTVPHWRAVFAKLVGPGRFEHITVEGDEPKTPLFNKPEHVRVRTLKYAKLAELRKRRRPEEQAQLERLQSQLKAEEEEERLAELPDPEPRKLYRNGSSAVALFADEKSVELVLKAVKKIKLTKTKEHVVWGDGVPQDAVHPLGYEWFKTYNENCYPGNDVVQRAMDYYFKCYNRYEKEAAQLAKALRNEPDEDGFVTVTRGGRSAPALQKEAEEAKQKMLEREQKKKDETTDFYRFQTREKRKAEQDEVQKRFDEDRKRVRAMQEQRGKFRPET
ncbi:ribosomal RNA-processing protein 7-domain-containing protein [Hypoxylon fuscum]|nr:ribosomal RNA-processing protein 7-domain-containing protein [Hypoxylon fuscum]